MAVARSPTTSTRGVIASAARLSPNRIVRCSSIAVSVGSAPARAEIAASRPSSSGERALASSSWGSTPSRRTTQFAELLSARITHLNAVANIRIGPAVANAAGIGRASAPFFGTSSPNSIDSRVARTRARIVVTVRVLSPASGRMAGANSFASAGSAR